VYYDCFARKSGHRGEFFCCIIYIEFKGGWLHALKQSNIGFADVIHEERASETSKVDKIVIKSISGSLQSTFKFAVYYKEVCGFFLMESSSDTESD
jgi:hypothetical protein